MLEVPWSVHISTHAPTDPLPPRVILQRWFGSGVEIAVALVQVEATSFSFQLIMFG